MVKEDERLNKVKIAKKKKKKKTANDMTRKEFCKIHFKTSIII